jgi:hypothetical protein
MNLAHLLNNSDPTQPRGIRVPGAESGSGAGAGALNRAQVLVRPQTSIQPSAPPVSTGMATVTRLHIASDALTLERVTGHLQEITARNGDSSEAVDVVVAVPAISWASQAGPEISRLMTTTAEMSASIMQRRITNRRIRWWLCVDLQFASETILTAVRVAGVSALRQMEPLPGVVGTLVLMGDPDASGDALQRFVTDPQWAGSCLIDLTGDVNHEGQVTANVVAVSPRQGDPNAKDQPTRHHDDLEGSRGNLHAELELVHGTLAHLNGQLRSVKGEFVAQHEQLNEVRQEYSATSQELVSYRNEIVNLKSELSVRQGQVAVLADQVSALQRELEYLEVHRSTLTKDLETERSAVRAAQDEVALQLSAAEQMRSAATRAEIEHSMQRAATEELEAQAAAAEQSLERTRNAFVIAQESLAALESVVAERGLEIDRLEQQRSRMKSEVERFEHAMLARLEPLKKELSDLHDRHEEALTNLNAVIAERQMLIATQDALVTAEEASEFSEARLIRDHLHRDSLMMRAARDHAEVELNEVLAELTAVREQTQHEEARWAQLHADGLARTHELEALCEELSEKNRELQAQNLLAENLLESAHTELDSVTEVTAAEHSRLDERQKAVELEISRKIEARWHQLISLPRSERKRMLREMKSASTPVSQPSGGSNGAQNL